MLHQLVQGLERYENGDWSASRLPDELITTEDFKAARRRNEGRKEEPEVGKSRKSLLNIYW